MSLPYYNQADLLMKRSDISTQLKIAKLLRLWNLSFSGDENEDETKEFIMQLNAFFISVTPETNVRDIFLTLPMIFKKAALKCIRPHECEICRKQFRNQENLEIHINAVHDRSKPFECDTCQKSFSYKSNLNRHMPLVYNSFTAFVLESSLIFVLFLLHCNTADMNADPCTRDSLFGSHMSPYRRYSYDSAKETEYETASTKKELRHEPVTSETSMIAKHQSASTDFDRYPQKTEFNNSLLLLQERSLWLPLLPLLYRKEDDRREINLRKYKRRIIPGVFYTRGLCDASVSSTHIETR
ncbi:unnamed protein product [Trichogramma brassicae]|uniref:C2H2-type domain-containing protein n=1 Tax=Trichogramma brassicae TaxID=86971 RepID=A0A6H5J513_9HYME|nr:unnamed protein product [Trichogramma brassicae]